MAKGYLLPGLFARPNLARIVLPATVGGSELVEFTNLTYITQAGNTYTSTAPTPVLPTDYWSANMVSLLKMAGDGFVQWPLVVGSSPPETGLVGLETTSTHTGKFETLAHSITNYLSRYHIFRSGTPTDTGVTASPGDLVRIRRSGTTLTYEKSSNGGGSWTSLGTDTGVSGNLYVHALLRSPGNQISNILSQGLA
jgi:hypothetical protein